MEGGALFERHPEWFHMNEAGTRVTNTHVVFCTSNREARQYLTANVIRYLDAHPEIEIFDFWPPDGARWCACPDCKQLGSPSDRQALLLTEVSAAVHKTRPGVRFETIAYNACLAPPTRTSMDSSVLIDFCPIAQCFEYQIDDPKSAKNAAYVTQLKAWVKSFRGDISIYSYYRKYAWRSLANIIPHYMQNDLKFYRDTGARGISSYAEPGDWATYEVNHYVLGALGWNPDMDVEAALREFTQARFNANGELAQRAYQWLEDNVRHLCSLPGTEMKTAAQYQRALDSLQTLAKEIDNARAGTSDKVSAAALTRLGLALEYVRLDLGLQKARVESADAQQRKAMIEQLGRFVQDHDQDGVFVTDRVPSAKQATRSGAPKK